MIRELARALGWLLAWAWLLVVLGVFAGCAIRWQEIPRYTMPGVRVYAVEFRWGSAAGMEPPVWATGCGTLESMRPC